MKITFGIFTFLSFYAIYAWGFYHFVPHEGYLILYLISLVFGVFFAYRYWFYLLDLIGKWRISFLIKNHDFQSLLELRKEIIKELEKAKQEYLETLANK